MNSIRILAAVAALVYVLPAGAQQPPASVRVASAQLVELAPTTTVPGTVTSRYDARLAAEVPGTLVEVADPGTTVARGDVVARIDDRQLRLQEAEYRAGVQRETGRLRFLTREVERLEVLVAEQTVARSMYEETVNNRDVSRAELAVQQARLEQVSDQLARTEIRAPFDGVVAERFSQTGERVGLGDTVVQLTSPGTLEIVARAPLAAVPFLAEGLRLRVEANGATNTAVIRSLVPFGDIRSPLFEVRLDLPTDTEWRAGRAVRVAVPVDGRREVVAVPRDALILRREGVSVFRVNEQNQAERVNVTTGASDGLMIEVIGGIRAGDQVVIRGGERLRPGQTVVVLDDNGRHAPGGR